MKSDGLKNNTFETQKYCLCTESQNRQTILTITDAIVPRLLDSSNIKSPSYNTSIFVRGGKFERTASSDIAGRSPMNWVMPIAG